MADIELSVRHLGINPPPLDRYRRTLFVALLVLIGLLLVNMTTDAEEEEGGPSYALAIGVIVLLVLVFLYEMVSLVHDEIAPRLRNRVICFHCHHLNPLPPPAKDGKDKAPLLKCGNCRRKLAPERSRIKVNYGAALTALGMPTLVEHLGHTSLEYRAWVGVAPSTFVAGDMVKGDKIAIRDTVIDKSAIGSGSGMERTDENKQEQADEMRAYEDGSAPDPGAEEAQTKTERDDVNPKSSKNNT